MNVATSNQIIPPASSGSSIDPVAPTSATTGSARFARQTKATMGNKRFNDAVSRLMIASMRKLAKMHAVLGTHACVLFWPQSGNPVSFSTSGSFSEMVRIYAQAAFELDGSKNLQLEYGLADITERMYAETGGAKFRNQMAIHLSIIGIEDAKIVLFEGAYDRTLKERGAEATKTYYIDCMMQGGLQKFLETSPDCAFTAAYEVQGDVSAGALQRRTNDEAGNVAVINSMVLSNAPDPGLVEPVAQTGNQEVDEEEEEEEEEEAEEEEEEEEEEEDMTYITCRICGKERDIPISDEPVDGTPWDCTMNRDQSYNKCIILDAAGRLRAIKLEKLEKQRKQQTYEKDAMGRTQTIGGRRSRAISGQTAATIAELTLHPSVVDFANALKDRFGMDPDDWLVSNSLKKELTSKKGNNEKSLSKERWKWLNKDIQGSNWYALVPPGVKKDDLWVFGSNAFKTGEELLDAAAECLDID